jgi:hypothetical protein
VNLAALVLSLALPAFSYGPGAHTAINTNPGLGYAGVGVGGGAPQGLPLTFASAECTLDSRDIDGDDTANAAYTSGKTFQTWTSEGVQGSACSVTQATVAKRPTYFASAHDYVRSDGSDDFMQDGSAITEVAQPYTHCAVVVPLTANNDAAVDGIDSAKRSEIRESGGFWAFAAGTSLASTTAPTVGQVECLCARADGTSSKIWLNGTEIASGDAGAHGFTGWSVFGNFNETAGSQHRAHNLMFAMFPGSIPFTDATNLVDSTFSCGSMWAPAVAAVLDYDSTDIDGTGNSSFTHLDPVTTWTNLGTESGANVTQSTGTAKPTYNDSGGVEWVDYDGGDWLQWVNTPEIVTVPWTGCVVAGTSVAANKQYFFDGDDSAGRTVLGWNISGGTNKWGLVSGGFFDTTNGTVNTYDCVCVSYISGASVVRVAGFADATSALGGAGKSGITLGATFDASARFVTGRYRRVQIFNADVGATQIAVLQSEYTCGGAF